MRGLLVSTFAISSLLACGGEARPSPVAPSNASAPSATTAAPVASTAPSAASTATDVDDEPDPTESATPIALEIVLPATIAKSDFPKAKATDAECWRGLELEGDHARDFASLIQRCGTPTGLREYAKPVSGHLHHAKDKRDTFTLKLRGGYCYRYFAVGDAATQDIDILVTTPAGAIVATDHGDSPTAIIEGERPWCTKDDVDYQFHVEVDGTGKGRYTFGVWARPN